MFRSAKRTTMKFPFIKTFVVAGTLALICNCGDDPVSKKDSDPKYNYIVADTSYIYVDQTNNVYIVSKNGSVTDTTGTAIGTADFSTGSIIDNRTPAPVVIAEGVDFSKLTVISPTIVRENGWLLDAGQTLIIYENNFVANANGENVGVFVPIEGSTTQGSIVTLDGELMVDGVDLSALTQVKPNIAAPVSSSSEKDAASLSSSSIAESSSSEPESSESSDPNRNCPIIKYVNGGAHGSGWATRYWDCCKPHCARDGGASQCDKNGNKINDRESGSVCTGGWAAACVSQAPFTIDGCETYGFAFAAVPSSNGGQCGKCFELTFTGEGKDGSNALHRRLSTKGKKLIVMASNIGSDVNQGQFDVMIPGGGWGQFNGCNGMNWGSQGAQYGGLLAECTKDYPSSPGKIPGCLEEKCNKSFANDSEARQGCMFLATWMEGADNPKHNFKEVECPQVLKNKY